MSLPSARLPNDPSIPWHRDRRLFLLAGWVVVGVLMFGSAVDAPVTRTQEARVLLTAREMVGKPLEGWLIPHMNGEPRLRKPPLAYWLSAAAYEALGTRPQVGRLPTLIAAWSTLAATFLIGRRLAGATAGALAAGALAGSWLFFKTAALAETDVLMMAGLTWAVYATLRARAARDADRAAAEIRWWHAAATCAGLAALAKGPQALCILLMFGLIDAVTVRSGGGRWRDGYLWRFVRSGAVATLLVVALPWFVYALSRAEGIALTDDLANSAGGGLGHAKSFVVYLPMLLTATAPWSVIWCIGLIGAARRLRRGGVRRNPGLLLLTAWGAALFVPLLFWGNKQMHYLLPIMPAAMIVVGAALGGLASRAARRVADLGPLDRRLGSGVLVVMFAAFLLVPPGVLLLARAKGLLALEDYVECAAAGALAVLLFVLWVRGRITPGTATVIGAIAALFLVRDEWTESVLPGSPETIAAELRRRFPDAHYVFRDEISLPLCLGLSGIIPVMDDAKLVALRHAAPTGRDVIGLDTTSGSEKRALPPGFEPLAAFGSGRDAVVAFTADGSRWDPDGRRDLP